MCVLSDVIQSKDQVFQALKSRPGYTDVTDDWLKRKTTPTLSKLQRVCVCVIPCCTWPEGRSPALVSVCADHSARSVPAGEHQCSCSPPLQCFQTVQAHKQR